ncbi:MAG: hypothetical protein JSS24_06560 [Proteobacteria bacterium]|nr:hypothetical protein [Pseudomonadota bacterium]
MFQAVVGQGFVSRNVCIVDLSIRAFTLELFNQQKFYMIEAGCAAAPAAALAPARKKA